MSMSPSSVRSLTTLNMIFMLELNTTIWLGCLGSADAKVHSSSAALLLLGLVVVWPSDCVKSNREADVDVLASDC